MCGATCSICGTINTCTVGAKKSSHFVSVARNERSAKPKTKRKRNDKTEARNETELVIKNGRWKAEISERTCTIAIVKR